MADDLGPAIDLFQPFRDFDAPTAAHSRATSTAPLLPVCSNVQPDALGDVAELAEQFRPLAERAGRRGLRIAYEALA